MKTVKKPAKRKVRKPDLRKVRVVTKSMAKRKPKDNKLFPGLPNYTGPTRGWFAFVHHGIIAEYSDDITVRLGYVRHHKPKKEIPIRLTNMMYIGSEALQAKLTKNYQEWSGRQYVPSEGRACFRDRDTVLRYVAKHNPEHAWSRGSLRFKNGQALQGF